MISVAIPHVETDDARRVWLTQIRRALAPLRPHVVPARGRPCWPTNRDALTWLALQPSGYGLWLQDDMLPVTGFPAALTRAVDWLDAQESAGVVSFFTMRKVIAAQSQSLISTPDGCWGGTVLASTALWFDFLAWERERIRPDYDSADRRLALYLLDHKIPCYVTNPSLIQHVGASASLMGHSNAKRIAAWLAPHGDFWTPTDDIGSAPGTLDPAARKAAYS